MTYITGIKMGTVLAVHGAGVFGDLIRFGSAMIDLPNLEAHIAVFDHVDEHGTPWGIEGRPGGVGWVDCTKYLNSVYTLTNRREPLTNEQRSGISTDMKVMLGTAYDWRAISEDALRDLHLQDPWGEKWNGEAAGHVVCSTAAVMAYAKNKADYPRNIDQPHVQPADWTQFIINEHYQ